MLALLALNACGSDSLAGDSGRDDSAKADARAPAKGTNARDGRLAGKLLVKPTTPKAGGTIRIAVENSGRRAMYYGLDNRIERRVGARWRDATADVFGTPDPGVRAILLNAPPGEKSGPNYGNVVDRIRLPRDLEPGRYRVVKRVSGNDRGVGPPQMTLRATFEVRRP
jgi:Big-like domain-containing protein